MLVGGLESSSRFSAEQKNKTSFFWLFFFACNFVVCLFFSEKLAKLTYLVKKTSFLEIFSNNQIGLAGLNHKSVYHRKFTFSILAWNSPGSSVSIVQSLV